MTAAFRLRVLPRVLPIDGREVGFQVTDTYIQWRYEATDMQAASDWENLVALSEITGPVGPNVELRNDGTNIQWRAEGDVSWNDLISVATITGPTGTPGADAGLLYSFDDGTSDADPGSGNLRADNADLSAATFLYISDDGRGGDDLSAFLLAQDGATANIIITDTYTDEQATFTLESVTDASGYVKFGIDNHSGATSLTDSNPVSLQVIGQVSTAVQTAAEAAQAAAETAQGAAEAAASLASQRYVRVRVIDTAGGDPASDYEAGDTIDGVTLASGDLVLRATASGNAGDGIYLVPDSGAASRSTQFDAYDDHPGAAVFVTEGTAFAATLWTCSSVAGGTLGSTALRFDQSFAIKGPEDDEVSRTVYLNLIETVRVSRWGVEPGETAANNTSRLTAALAAKDKAEFVFAGGDYEFDDLLTVPNGSINYFIGQGAGVTRLVQTDLTKGLLKFDINYAQGGGIRGVTLAGDTPFGDAGSTGIGLHIDNANDNFSCKDFDIVGFDKGLRVDGSYYPRFSDFRIIYFTDYGILLGPYSIAGTDSAASHFVNGKISNFGFTGTNTGSIGVDIQQASGEFFDTLDITTTNIGIRIAPPSGSYARYLFMRSVLADSSLTYGWLFDGTNAPVVALDLKSCWASNVQGAQGVRIQGANLDDLKWGGGFVRDCREEGVRLVGGTNIRFVEASISRNSASSSNTYSGFNVSGGVSDWAVLNCRIGNFSETVNSSTQLHNISIESGASQNFRVIGNDLRSPGSGGLSLNNGSTLENWVIADNLPLQTAGTNRRNATHHAGVSSGPVAAASTVYLGTVGQQSDEGDGYIMVGRGGRVSQFIVEIDTPPGSAQSFTYTLRKNNVDTAMAGSISGTGTFQLVLVSGFTVSPADRLSIKLVTSASAATSRHRWSLTIDP